MTDGLEPNSNAQVVQHGLDQARQTLLSCAAPSNPTGGAGGGLPMAALVPMASADELIAAIAGPAVKAVLEMRIEQIVRYGHAAETDRLLPIGMLVKDARERAQMASDCLWGEKRNLKVARRRIAIAAALLLAAIDRLDFETELEPVQPVRGSGEHGSPKGEG